MIKNLVSVIGTSYNNSSFEITRCLKSILNQSYKFIEIIIVLEPNTKNLNSFIQFRKKNIKIIYNQKKEGFVKSLNIGLNSCKGEYISRIDFDDYYNKSKIYKQVNFLKKNKSIDVCGTAIKYFNGKKNFVKIFPKNHNEILRNFFLFNSIAHSSVMMRYNLIKKFGRYNQNYKFSEDLEIWFKFISKGVKFYNLNYPLTFYNIQNKSFLREKENFIYNFKARKKYSKKIFGFYFGILNIIIFKILLLLFPFIRKLINSIIKI